MEFPFQNSIVFPEFHSLYEPCLHLPCLCLPPSTCLSSFVPPVVYHQTLSLHSAWQQCSLVEPVCSFLLDFYWSTLTSFALLALFAFQTSSLFLLLQCFFPFNPSISPFLSSDLSHQYIFFQRSLCIPHHSPCHIEWGLSSSISFPNEAKNFQHIFFQ